MYVEIFVKLNLFQKVITIFISLYILNFFNFLLFNHILFTKLMFSLLLVKLILQSLDSVGKSLVIIFILVLSYLLVTY